VSDESPMSNTDNPIQEVLDDDVRETRRGRYGWLSLVVAGLFGLFFAYELWEAVSNLVALPAFYEAFGYGAENVPWWLMWVGVIIPVAVYVIAFVIGRHRGVGGKALVFLVGLAVVAGLSITLAGFEEVIRAGLS
jgi:hypothetical protein